MDKAPQDYFRNSFAFDIFQQKYAHEGCETWPDIARVVVEDVCRDRLNADEKGQLVQYITDMKFIPGGRYLYYAGRELKAFNNCYLLRSEEDSREDWANTSWKSERCLTLGGGIGNDYSVYRCRGSHLRRTGGTASGAVSKAEMINDMGRYIMQGASRRAAIYASLHYQHGDVEEWLNIKDWDNIPVVGTDFSVGDLKKEDFNFKAPLDYTNISLNYDTKWLEEFWRTGNVGDVFTENVRRALRTGDPGFSFNFFDQEQETLRNACTEVTSADDSDVCNLASVNIANVRDMDELSDVVSLGTKFLLCGTLVADLPYDKIYTVRQQNRRLGLGLMGIHEWLLQRGQKYEVTAELHRWLTIYERQSTNTSVSFANDLSVSVPVANRAIAPTGTIGIMACTSTAIEPIFAVAYKRRYLKKGQEHNYQYVVDSTAQYLIDEYGLKPDDIDTSMSLVANPVERIKFQAHVQDYVDMAISSTINLPAWGTEHNNEDTVEPFAKILAEHAHRLRGFTCYPDGARGGQPLTPVTYDTAIKYKGEEFQEIAHDVCDITNKGGTCSS